MYRTSPQRKSAVLILALLLMGAIIGSSIALSTVISDSNHQTTILNQFIEASIAADNGLERSLAVLKVGRVDQSLVDAKAAINSGVTATSPRTVVNVTDANADQNSVVIPKLRPGESYSFDVIPSAAGPTPLNTLSIGASCASAEACALEKLTVSWIGLNNNLETIYSGQAKNSIIFDTNPISGKEVHLYENAYYIDPLTGQTTSVVPLASTHGYRIRLTAMVPAPASTLSLTAEDLAIHDISVVICEAASGPCTNTSNSSFASRLAITSIGKVQSSQSSKTVTVPWQPGASGIFNYVIFSEGAIDKTI